MADNLGFDVKPSCKPLLYISYNSGPRMRPCELLFQQHLLKNIRRSIRFFTSYLLKYFSRNLRGCALCHFTLLCKEDLNVILSRKRCIRQYSSYFIVAMKSSLQLLVIFLLCGYKVCFFPLKGKTSFFERRFI